MVEFKDMIQRVESVVEEPLNKELTANFYMAGMHSSLAGEFKSSYAMHHPEMLYEWTKLEDLTTTFGEWSSTTNNDKHVDHRARKAINAVVNHMHDNPRADSLLANMDSPHTSGSSTHNPCSKCGDKCGNGKPHLWWRCPGVDGYLGPNNSGGFKWHNITIKDTPEGQKLKQNGGTGKLYCFNEGKGKQYFDAPGYSDTPGGKMTLEMLATQGSVQPEKS